MTVEDIHTNLLYRQINLISSLMIQVDGLQEQISRQIEVIERLELRITGLESLDFLNPVTNK